MPNGGPNWMKEEYPKLEEFFGRISSVLEQFSKEHNLKIEKYPHRTPSWIFRFRHPKGGVGQIEVHRHDEGNIEIMGVWWIDDYDTQIRFLKNPKGTLCSLDKFSLNKTLKGEFNRIVSWDKEDFEKSFKVSYLETEKIGKEEFEKQFEKYPIPKM